MKKIISTFPIIRLPKRGNVETEIPQQGVAKSKGISVFLTLAIIIFLAFALPNIAAFGVSCPYWKERPLIISSEEQKNIECLLQNMAGGKDIELKAEILSGAEIAQLVDKNPIYLVPFGKKDVKVSLQIKIPKNVKSSNYTISLLFKQLLSEKGQMLQLSGAVTNSFEVIVQSANIEKTEESPIQQPYLSQEVQAPSQKQSKKEYSATKLLFKLILTFIISAIFIVSITIIFLLKARPKKTF